MGFLGALLLVVPAACMHTSNDPVPFETGQVVPPPFGCADLRKNEPDGDC